MLSLKFSGKSKKNGGDISPASLVFRMYALEVVKQMSVLRSRQSWPTKPNGPFIVQNVHPHLRKTQNQLQINLGTVFTHSHFVPLYLKAEVALCYYLIDQMLGLSTESGRPNPPLNASAVSVTPNGLR